MSLETTYGSKMKIQLTGNRSGGLSCTQLANYMSLKMKHTWHCGHVCDCRSKSILWHIHNVLISTVQTFWLLMSNIKVSLASFAVQHTIKDQIQCDGSASEQLSRIHAATSSSEGEIIDPVTTATQADMLVIPGLRNPVNSHLCTNHAVWSASCCGSPARWMDRLGPSLASHGFKEICAQCKGVKAFHFSDPIDSTRKK